MMPRKSAPSMEDAFLHAILENPDDDVPRLVFADWLEEQGNPRGTFIRLQCQRAKLTPFDPAWKELLSQESILFKQFESEWSKPILRLVDQVEYRRGFIEHVRVSATRLLKNAVRLFRSGPVCSIRLERLDRLAEIAESPWFGRVKELDLSQENFGSKSLQSMVQSEHCRSLGVLRLDHCVLLHTPIQLLASASTLQSLHALSLAGNSLGADDALLLASSLHLANLRDLNVADNKFGLAGVAGLCRAPTFCLTRLNLANNGIGNDGAAAIACCRELADLRNLDLANNAVGNLGVEALVKSPHLQSLEHLNLSQNHISGRGIQLLTDSALLANLTHLNLKHNEIDKATMATLPVRLHTPKMRELLY